MVQSDFMYLDSEVIEQGQKEVDVLFSKLVPLYIYRHYPTYVY